MAWLEAIAIASSSRTIHTCAFLCVAWAAMDSQCILANHSLVLPLAIALEHAARFAFAHTPDIALALPHPIPLALALAPALAVTLALAFVLDVSLVWLWRLLWLPLVMSRVWMPPLVSMNAVTRTSLLLMCDEI